MDIERKILKKISLEKLLEKLTSEGQHVYAPVKKESQVNFERISSLKDMTEDYIVTNQSAKFIVFPRVEKLIEYEIKQKEVEMTDVELDKIPYTVLVGARPCDTDGFASLNAIFTWDYTDKIFVTRLERTTIIGLSCNKCDEYCFCTSLDGSPGSTRGSDILLTKLQSEDYLAEIITEKGKNLVSKYPELFETATDINKEQLLANVPVKFTKAELKAKLELLFNNEEFWKEQSLACYGCGCCAFVCPTCACFDIQDESNLKKGNRVRLWDSCGFGQFTLHTSGHNPREIQSHRWRQRLMHKFSYMPDRLDVLGCIGCGRCSRACAADMNLLNHLINVMEVK